jgi:uncharacterized membrane protein
LERGEDVSVLRYSAIGLAALGFYIASYFSLVYYGIVAANTRLMPNVCRLEDRTCRTVLTTKYARVFGVPNSLLGVLYYLAVILLLLAGWTGALAMATIVVAWFTVALGFFLIYSLFFIIKIPCPLCLTAHAINLLLAILLTAILL